METVFQRHYRRRLDRLLWLCFALGVSVSRADIVPSASNAPDRSVTAEIKTFFKDSRMRLAGSVGNLAIEKKVDALFESSGFRHGQIAFFAPAFAPGKTTLAMEGMDPIPLLPMHPTLMRPGNFPSPDFAASLVYLGRGSFDDLEAAKGISLDGAIALMEFDCGDSWQRFLRFGVKGFVFIGGDDYFYQDVIKKVTRAEVSIPRFFVRADQGKILRDRAKGQATPLQIRIQAEPSRWHQAMLRDLWVFVPGTDSALEREVCVFVAPLDSNGIVPELAEGAQSGANLFLLMRLLDEFKTKPPDRSVLLVAVNAHSQYFLGERMLSWHLLAPMPSIEAVRNGLSTDIRYEELMLNTYGKVRLDKTDKTAEDFLIGLRSLEDKSTGKNVILKTPMVARIKRDVNSIKTRLLAIQKNQTTVENEKRNESELRTELQQYVNVLTLFNKVGIRTQLSDLTPAEVGILQRYIDDILSENRTWLELNRKDLNLDVENGAIREALTGRTVAMVFSLDLRWRTPQIGFCSIDASVSDTTWSRRFGANSVRIAASLSADTNAPAQSPLVDTMTMCGGLSQVYYFSENRSSIGHFSAAQRTPALSLQNVFCDPGLAFTPADVFDSLDETMVSPVMDYVPTFFRAILADRNIMSSEEIPPVKTSLPLWSIQIKTFEFDPFSASVVPDMPISNSLAILYPKTGYDLLVGGDVMACYAVLTDARAGRHVIGVKDALPAATAAYRLAPDGTSIDRVIDAGDVQNKLNSNISTPGGSHMLALFPCKEIVLSERNDPSSLAAAPLTRNKYLVLEGGQNAAPRRYGLGGVSALSSKEVPFSFGPAAVYVEPRDRVKILTDNMRLALNATETMPAGIGFTSTSELGSDFYATAAQDMSRLNRDRLKDLRGVSNQLVLDCLRRGQTMLQETKAAWDRRDHNAYLAALYEALGSQVKAYSQISATRNDMLKAIVFYMALLLPFCFFVQRLLFKTVRIEAQMALFAVLFIVTFILFRTIHPAFQVSRSPEAIFIAFVMGTLGIFVISILHSRFEGEMQLLFSTFGALDPSEIGYSTASQQAMMIGVHNMKRRRVRTTLTTATIVLVTFTMLAFSSISKKMSPTVIPVTKEAPYSGIFFQWPGSQQMDEPTLQTFVDTLARDSESINVRRWLLPPQDELRQTVPFSVRSSAGIPIQIEAILGLPTTDNGFLSPMPLLGESRFFSSDNAAEVILPARTAEALKLSLNDIGKVSLTFMGHSFKLVGIVHDERFHAMKDLNTRPLLPIKRIENLGSQALEPGLDLNPASEESGVFYADMAALMILPVDTARDLGARAFSVSVRLKKEVSLWRVVDRILTVTEAKFFVGSRNPFPVGDAGEKQRSLSAGVYYIGSGYKTSIGGLARLLIPLLIASTIILNTMLGSVYERKSEIAVYNAVGLNPTHIGMFFLAEAFVYSVIGSVGGYLIGQMLSLGLVRLNLFGDINLNFSSLSVMYVILFTVGVVLLSTLYPAIVATRAAVPSGKRKWSMPPHDGHQMNVVFPFIYQPDLVPGLVAYIEEYFTAYTEASVGELMATLRGRKKVPDTRGRDAYELEYEIALAPYDLGVTQRVQFMAAFDDIVQSYRIRMLVTRLSGQDANWVTTNKPFLERLRKHLMHWRNLSPADRATYAEQAKGRFDAPRRTPE